jgi:hypothetical protein
MSTLKKPLVENEPTIEAIDEQAITDYLQAHPDFFEENLELLA